MKWNELKISYSAAKGGLSPHLRSLRWENCYDGSSIKLESSSVGHWAVKWGEIKYFFILHAVVVVVVQCSIFSSYMLLLLFYVHLSKTNSGKSSNKLTAGLFVLTVTWRRVGGDHIGDVDGNDVDDVSSKMSPHSGLGCWWCWWDDDDDVTTIMSPHGGRPHNVFFSQSFQCCHWLTMNSAQKKSCIHI